MAAPKKKASAKKKSRWRLVLKLLLLFGAGGVIAFIAALFVMEQELNRIGFFTKVKRPSFQLPKPLSTEPAPPEAVQPPAQVAGPAGRESAPTHAAEDISPEDREELDSITSARPSRPAEELSREDKRLLDDILRTR